jgi:hypothetical protein
MPEKQVFFGGETGKIPANRKSVMPRHPIRRSWLFILPDFHIHSVLQHGLE